MGCRTHNSQSGHDSKNEIAPIACTHATLGEYGVRLSARPSVRPPLRCAGGSTRLLLLPLLVGDVELPLQLLEGALRGLHADVDHLVLPLFSRPLSGCRSTEQTLMIAAYVCIGHVQFFVAREAGGWVGGGGYQAGGGTEEGEGMMVSYCTLHVLSTVASQGCDRKIIQPQPKQLPTGCVREGNQTTKKNVAEELVYNKGGWQLQVK